MAINNIINDSWQGHTHGEVEDALKVLLSQMLEDIASAGIPDGGITIEMLASALRTKITNAVSAIQVNGTSKVPSNGIVSLDPYYTKTQVDGMFSDVDDELAGLATVAFSGSYNDLTGKPEIPTQAQLESMIEAALEDVDLDDYYTKDEVEGLIPASTSDLTNDSGFLTAQDVSGMVAATADLTIVENDNYIDITISSPALTVTSLAPMSATTKSGTFKVSGTHLKGDVTISMSATNWTMSVGGGAASQTLTLSPTDGILAETTITVTYSGSTDSTGNTITIASQDAVSKTVTANYTVTAGPTIFADDSLTIKAATGQSNTGTLQVTGSQLTAGITATVSGTGFTVSNSESGTYGNQASLPSSGGTLYVKFSPTGSTGSTGTLTLASTGATSKTVDLTGAVSTLTVSPQSLTFSTDQNVAVTDTFTIQGTNLTGGVTLTLTDANSVFSLSKNSLTKAEAEAGETITVTYNSSAAGNHSGSIAVAWDGTSQNVGLSGSAAAAAALDANGRFNKGGIYYGAESDGNGGWTNNVKVYNSQYKTNAVDSSANKYSGVLNIPSTVTALKDNVETTFNVIGVAEYAFRGNTAITSITLPDSVTSIAAHIVFQCTGLTYLNTGNGITSLPYDFGNGLTALQELVIGDSVVDLKVNGAPFSGCSALRTVTLGSSVQYIGQLLDYNQGNGVTTIICRGESPTIPVVNLSTAHKIYNAANITVYIPSGQRAYYIAAQDSRSDVIAGYSEKTIWKYFDDNNRLIEQ